MITNIFKLYILLIFNLLVISCKGQEKQITYAVHINSLTPYELYLDYILVDYYYGDNQSKTVVLNPYLLSNGKHQLKIKFFPANNNIYSKNGLLSPKDIFLNNDTRWRCKFSAKSGHLRPKI